MSDQYYIVFIHVAYSAHLLYILTNIQNPEILH